MNICLAFGDFEIFEVVSFKQKTVLEVRTLGFFKKRYYICRRRFASPFPHIKSHILSYASFSLSVTLLVLSASNKISFLSHEILCLSASGTGRVSSSLHYGRNFCLS